MRAWICLACGVQYAPTEKPLENCFICEDERQFVNHRGQKWISPSALASHHTNRFQQLEHNLFEIKTDPPFAIGQRALLILSKRGMSCGIVYLSQIHRQWIKFEH